jgi:hypothetical protein
VVRLANEAERIQRQLAQARTQLNLMYELLATVTHAPVGLQGRGSPARSVRETVAEAVRSMLLERGAPMRIQDIHSEFLRRELPLPGSGTPANIAAHLVDRGVFSRPRRGIFGLVEWDRGQTGLASSPANSRVPSPGTEEYRPVRAAQREKGRRVDRHKATRH